jgi:hypothetical protein
MSVTEMVLIRVGPKSSCSSETIGKGGKHWSCATTRNFVNVITPMFGHWKRTVESLKCCGSSIARWVGNGKKVSDGRTLVSFQFSNVQVGFWAEASRRKDTPLQLWIPRIYQRRWKKVLYSRKRTSAYIPVDSWTRVDTVAGHSQQSTKWKIRRMRSSPHLIQHATTQPSSSSYPPSSPSNSSASSKAPSSSSSSPCSYVPSP